MAYKWYTVVKCYKKKNEKKINFALNKAKVVLHSSPI